MKPPLPSRFGRLRAFRQQQQRGFIPMMIMIVVVLTGVIYFAFTRVLRAQH